MNNCSQLILSLTLAFLPRFHSAYAITLVTYLMIKNLWQPSELLDNIDHYSNQLSHHMTQLLSCLYSLLFVHTCVYCCQLELT